MRRLFLGALVATAVSLLGCKEQAVTPFKLIVHVDSDPGQALTDLPILFNDAEVKRTDAKGDALIETKRPDGEVVTLVVKCPADSATPEPVRVTVRRTEGQSITKFDRACRPQTRSIAVLVRAENGPNLPVMYLGKEVARTDSSGAAHYALKLKVGEPFTIGLSTNGNKDDQKLRPPNPSVPLIVGEGDEVKLINIKFERPKAAPVFVVRPTGPREVH
jgi:hypothetical protein